MRILGIETSCDETAVCIIEASGDIESNFKFEVLGNALYSQVSIHAPYGGVFPNLAKREHAKNLIPLLSQVFLQALEQNPQGRSLVRSVDNYQEDYQGRSLVNSKDTQGLKQSFFSYQGPTLVKATLVKAQEILMREADMYEQLVTFLDEHEKPDIDAIAVTYGPGLEPALWVGVNLARALSIIWEIPLVAVDHMEGHIILSALVGKESSKYQVASSKEIQFPLLSLLISGGHTELVLSRKWMQYEVIGQTRDDAVGEAFDKVARLLGLPYPGGPEISRLAAQSRSRGLTSEIPGVKPRKISFTPPMLHSKDFDFSFSGLKTEVRKFVEGRELDDDMKMEIARAFEDAVAQVLVSKTMKAVDEFGACTVIVGGGVSANVYIRTQLAEALGKGPAFTDVRLLVPPANLATDNALMIALAGYFHAVKKDFADPTALRANGNLRLA